MRSPHAVPVGSLILASLGVVGSATAQVALKAKPESLRQTATALSGRYNKLVDVRGCAVAEASPLTKGVWAASLSCPGNIGRVEKAGFTLPSLTSAGSVPNVKVTVTFEVSQVVGYADLYAFALKGQSQVSAKAQSISKPGKYSVTSLPFNLEPNQQYQAAGAVGFASGAGVHDVCAVVARVSEIRWSF